MHSKLFLPRKTSWQIIALCEDVLIFFHYVMNSWICFISKHYNRYLLFKSLTSISGRPWSFSGNLQSNSFLEIINVIHIETERLNSLNPIETLKLAVVTAQKMKFSNKDFFKKCDQICSTFAKKSLMETFIFCVLCD